MDEWWSEAVFTGVGRHVPYGVGQWTLVHLEMTHKKQNEIFMHQMNTVVTLCLVVFFH